VSDPERSAPERRALIVGAGVSGLSCALRLTETGWDVRILSRERSPGTTSDVAAAVWYPYRVGLTADVLRWGRETFDHFLSLALEAPEAGVTMVEGIEPLREAPTGPPDWAHGLPGFRAAAADELPAWATAGWRMQVPVIEMPTYLAWLEDRLADRGVAIDCGHIEDLDAALADAPLVVNTTGLGAAALTGDRDLHPVRGQIVRVAPGLADRFVQDGESGPADGSRPTYIIPRRDCTVLGGTADVGATDLTPDPAISADIHARCAALVPALVNATTLSVAVGLRPARSTVRLEAEPRDQGAIVHNYGHGGAGVTLSWGCAGEVLALAERHLAERAALASADNRALVRERFGANAASYGTSTVHAKGWSLQRLVELTRPQATWRVLDVATGGGHTALAFAPHVARVEATDITPEMLEVGRSLAVDRGLDNVTFAPADAMNLPYEDLSFDLVTCRIAPHHFPDVGAFVAESARVLVPGGLLAVVDNIVPEDRRAADFVNDFERRRDPGHAACLSSTTWASHFAAAGLELLEAEAVAKTIHFDPWVDRQDLDDATRRALGAMLEEAPPSAADFLRPRRERGDRVFDLREGIFVARKAG
jgi:D-amino-acid oxidase